MDSQISDLPQIIQGVGTSASGVIIFLLWRLTKEMGELKTELKTFTDVMSRFVPGAKP